MLGIIAVLANLSITLYKSLFKYLSLPYDIFHVISSNIWIFAIKVATWKLQTRRWRMCFSFDQEQSKESHSSRSLW